MATVFGRKSDNSAGRSRELCRQLAGAVIYGRKKQGHRWVANSLPDQPVAGIWPQKDCSGGANTAKVARMPRWIFEQTKQGLS